MKKLLAASALAVLAHRVAFDASARSDHRRRHPQGDDRQRVGLQRRRPPCRRGRAPHLRQRRNQPPALWRPDLFRAVDGRVESDRNAQRRHRESRHGLDEHPPGRVDARRQPARAADGRRIGVWPARDEAVGLSRRSKDARRSSAPARRRSRREFGAGMDAGWLEAVRRASQPGRRCRRASGLQGDPHRPRRRAVVEAVPGLGCDEPIQSPAFAGGDRSRDGCGDGHSCRPPRSRTISCRATDRS